MATSTSGAAAEEDYKTLSSGKLKRLLVREGVDCSDCIERSDLLEKAQRWKRRRREVEERKWGSSPSRPYELMCTPAHPQGRKLQDLCSGGFRAAFVSSMLIDPDWFCDNFPDLVKCGELVVAHGLDRDQGAIIENRLKSSRAKVRKTEGRLIVHRPPLPIPYGTHHSKFFILFHESGFLRLIIHTANLSDENVNWKTQGVWWQDFRFKSGDPERACKFERDLVDYLKRVLPKQENSILENVRKVDFSSAEALGLVASVPGYHKGADRDEFGHMKVRSLLEKEEFGSCFAGSPLIYQFSSLGSLDEKWLKGEFTKSCSSGIEASTGKALGNPRDMQEDLCIVWPTMAEVINSLEGIRAGEAIPGPVKNVDKPFLQKHYRRWGKCRAAPHIKTFARCEYNSHQSPRHAWVLLGSHNLSKAAWGCLQKKDTQLMVRSYELGVLVKVNNHEDNPSSASGTQSVPEPYPLPPQKYATGDTPWAWDRLPRLHI